MTPRNPTPAEIREARHRAGLTQTEAAALLDRKPRIWQRWEAGTHPMPKLLWELFQDRTKNSDTR